MLHTGPFQEAIMAKEAAALLGIGLLVGGYYLYFAPGLTEKNARRVRGGMTQVEVEALFGCPPTGKHFQDEDGTPLPNGFWIVTWQETDRKACVCFGGGTASWITFRSGSSNYSRNFYPAIHSRSPSCPSLIPASRPVPEAAICADRRHAPTAG
jgi:hypothetical protein